MSRKIFVGSLPHGIQESTLRAEFEKYGTIDNVYVKQDCEPGRQWAFVTYLQPEHAQRAKELCDRVLTFPGSDKPCDIMVAKNQGMGGQAMPSGPYGGPPVAPSLHEGPRKVHVGSLPNDITDGQLRNEFQKYGTVEDIFISNQDCEPGRQWGFVTFASHAQAQLAKQSADNVLTFPGSKKACEVTLARNQGMFGQDNLSSKRQAPDPYGGFYGPPAYGPPAMAAPMPTPNQAQPKKIFVGSLPDDITESTLREEFGKFGEVTDVFLKTGCEPGRQWSFITYATSEQASHAKTSTDRILVMPGHDKACEVMLARNQGKFGQEPLEDRSRGSKNHGGNQPTMMPYGGQPPPPTGPPPAHLTPWRTYYTAAGLPYYHNAKTNVTQWECPPDFQVPAPAMPPMGPMGGMHYAPYGAMYPPQMPMGYRPY